MLPVRPRQRVPAARFAAAQAAILHDAEQWWLRVYRAFPLFEVDGTSMSTTEMTIDLASIRQRLDRLGVRL